MRIVICVIFLMIGAAIGGIFSLLFFRMDEGWKRVATFVFGSGTSIGAFELFLRIIIAMKVQLS